MPGSEVSVADLRREVVALAAQEGANVAEQVPRRRLEARLTAASSRPGALLVDLKVEGVHHARLDHAGVQGQ